MNTEIIPATNTTSAPSAHQNFSVKLTPKNYLAWKAQFLPLLNYQGLLSFVDGTSPAPSRTIASTTNPTQQIPNPEFDPWFKKDQMLHSWMLSSLTEEIFPYIIGLSSSLQIW